jgi:hypothetical protein
MHVTEMNTVELMRTTPIAFPEALYVIIDAM